MDAIDRIVNKLERLRTLRPGEPMYELRPPLAPDEVAAFEREQRVALPDDYREFLVRVANGGNFPPYLMALTAVRSTGFDEELRDGERMSDPAEPFPFVEEWVPPAPDAQPDLPPGANPHDGCVHVRDRGCADLIVLVVTGEARGQVWEDLTPYDQRIGPVAPSFSAWYEAELDEALRWAAPSVT